MNVQPQIHGLPVWHFPSPSSTPKTAFVHQAPFQTPKSEPPSHFADAWSTPQINVETPAQTPALHQFTIAQRPAKQLHSPLTPDDPKFHVNHFTKAQNLLPPVEPSRQLSSSPDPLKSSATLQKKISAPALKVEAAMNPFQMQTPPPTRDSSSRRDFHGQQGMQRTPSGVFNPHSTPSHPPMAAQMQTPNFQTPNQYPNLQFTPEMFQFPTTGPASAPAVPQPHYPWDQSPQMGFATGMMNAQQNPFGPSNPISPAMANWPSNNPSPVEMQCNFQQSQQHMAVPQHQEQDFWMSGSMSQPSATSFEQDTSFVSATSGVNPNMLFSFSSPPQTINPTSVNVPQAEQRQPYEHQTRESNRERELAKKSRQVSRSGAQASNSFPGGPRPGLHRSNTDSGFRLVKNRSVSSNQAIENIPRRSSPLKRHSQASLSAIPETIKPRLRTRLVIDETGRARTETEPASDDTEDDLPTRPLSVFEDDNSSDDDVGITSQRNSFALPSDLPRPTKHARIDSDPDRFETSKRPLSSASIVSITSRLQSTPLSNRTGDFRRASMGSYGGNDAENLDSRAPIESPSDAQAALKQLVNDRKQRQEQNDPQAVLRAHNQRWSQASIDMAKFQALQQQQQQQGFDPYANNISPANTMTTDSNILTPSTDRSSRSSDSTRCVCSSMDNDGGLMIQCESCTKWLHVRCIGLNANSLPPVYVCIFCTGQTPVARHGRIREPMRQNNNHTSPLNYKSGNNPFRR